MLIVGGGIGGLTLALALRRLGLEARVFEKTPELKEVGAAILLWPNATRILRDVGVLDPLLERSDPVTDCEIRSRDGSLIKRWKVPRLDAPAVFVSRADLQTVLVAALSQETIRLGQTCAGFEESADGVTARFASGETARGSILVGADGLHSIIRARLMGEKQPIYQGYTQWRAILDDAHEVLKPGLKMEWWGPGIRFGMARNGRGRMNWFVSANRPAPEAAANGKERLLEWVRGWASPVEEIIRGTPEAIILKTDIWARPPSDVWGRDRVTLLGDAAHPTSPNLGQGAGMAIEDAGCLAACLAASEDAVAALRRYEALRKKRTAATTAGSGLVGRMGQWSHPALVAARTLFLKAFPTALWERRLKTLYAHRIDLA